MDNLNYIIPAILLVFILFQFSIYFKAYKLKGTDIRSILKEEGLSGQYDEVLLFFHSEHCPPCKQMMPDIKELMKSHDNILPLDIGIFMNLAKRLNVRATPTTIFIKNGSVEKVLLGAQSKQKIAALFS